MFQPNVVYVGENEDCMNSVGAEDLTILSININRVANKLSLLELFINSFSQLEKSVDIIFLSETFLKSNETQFFNLNGYHAYHFTRESRMGGGIVFYVRTGIKVNHKFQKIAAREVQILVLHLNDLNLNICGVYRPPSSPNSNMREFLDLMDETLEKHKNMICVGDMNIDLLGYESEELKTLIKCNNFSILNKIEKSFFTRRSTYSNSIIDHCYTDLTNNFMLQLGDTVLSDHKFMFVLVDNVKKLLPIHPKTKKFINYEKIANCLKKNFPVSKFTDFENFSCTLNNLVAQETKIIKKKPSSYFKKPWATNELKDLCKRKRKFFKLMKAFPKNEYFRSKFLEIKKNVNIEVNKSRKVYYTELYGKNIGNKAETWRITKEIMTNKSPTNEHCDVELRVHGHLLTDQEKVANEINKFFTLVGSCSANDEETLNFEFESRPVLVEKMEIFHPTCPVEIGEIIQALKNTKSMGCDEIPVTFLKNNKFFFSNLLSSFINTSFEQGKFPDSLKLARVTPLFKGGDPMDVGNYRPISVLPIFSKVFETVMKRRLLKHLKTNEIIHPHQYGFMENSCTTSAASCLVNEVVDGINKKLKTACVFVDVKKAFDCLNFEILGQKLFKIGIEGKALELLQSYFVNRRQLVVLNGIESETRNVISGAAQGSILGPLLFNIYINDLLFLKLNSTGRLFADDAGFIYQANDYPTLYCFMHDDLITIQSFLKSINLEMSIKKTQFMIFRSRNSTTVDLFNEIRFNNNSILRVENFKYLGLNVDEKITWKVHVDYVCKQIAPYVGLIRRIRHVVEQKILLTIYYAYIHSRLLYCLPIWASCALEQKMRIQRIQNKAIKMIRFQPPKTPSNELYDEKFLSFLQLCNYESILFIHKISINKIKCDFELVSNETITNRSTRQSNLLRPPNFLMSKSQVSLFYRGINLYNKFAEYDKLIKSKSLSYVKSSLKKFVATNSTNT